MARAGLASVSMATRSWHFVGGVAGMIITGYSLEHGMPPFGHLLQQEIAAITTYVRNLWSNAFGGPTDPTIVQSLRATVGGE